MDFCIDKKLLGTPFHLLCSDGKYHKVSDMPPEALRIPSKRFDNLARVCAIEFISFPSEPFQDAYKTLVDQGTDIPWHYCIPQEKYKSILKEYLNHWKQQFNNLDTTYYDKYFSESEQTFKKLQPACINVQELQKSIIEEKNLAQKEHMKSFLPKDDSCFVDPPTYCRTKSVTKRMTIESGPNILLLRKQNRNILQSRFGDKGSIYQVDFKSLEPRTLIATNTYIYNSSIGNVPLDIYQKIARDCKLPSNIDRKLIKTTIIAIINGAKREMIVKHLESHIDFPDDFVDMINNFFRINEERERLATEYQQNDRRYIENFFGQKVTGNNVKPSTLVNYFVQSTAVDVAMIGFKQIIDGILEQQISNIIPIYILHDALILDVHDEALPKLKEIKHLGEKISPFDDFTFFLSMEKVYNKTAD